MDVRVKYFNLHTVQKGAKLKVYKRDTEKLFIEFQFNFREIKCRPSTIPLAFFPVKMNGKAFAQKIALDFQTNQCYSIRNGKRGF